MVDVFEEVEEQLRSARYQTILRKGWPWALGVVVVALLVTFGVWGYRQQQLTASARASEGYQDGLAALTKGDRPAAEKAFAKVAADGPLAYKAMAMMQQAGLLTVDRKTAEAVALLDKAADTAKDPALADAAKLKAAYLVFDNASLADMEKRLTPLAEAGRPYSALAREALAMKRMASGQGAAARSALSLLAISPDAGEGLQARANIAMGVVDSGQTANLTAAAKAAAALPPEKVLELQRQAAQAQLLAQAQQAQAQQAQQGGAPAPSQAPTGAAQ